jgi:beta-glucosidase
MFAVIKGKIMRLVSKSSRGARPVIVLTVVLAGLTTARAQERPLYLDDTQPVEARVNDLLPRLTLEEKISLVHANGGFSTAGVSRLGIPGLVMDDGPLGVREEMGEHFKNLHHMDDFATAMPGALGLTATWDTNLARAFGAVIGQEAKQRGKNIMLGPAVNIQRTPLCGRNFEYMGEDPFLTSRMAVNYIEGEQAQGVSSCIKHFAANNQEFERGSINEIIDERTLREIYLPAFRAAVQEAGAMAVMAAYNQINGEFCAENPHLLKDILKDDWGFKGVVISDWGAVHHTDLAARNGMDIEMGTGRPYDDYYLAGPFLDELKAGKLPMSTLDEMVRRHLYVMFKLNLIHDPSVPVTSAPVQTPLSTAAHQEMARQIAEASFVLLKDDGFLPLQRTQIKTLAIIGGNAVAKFCHEGGSANIKAPFEITALEGISNYVGGDVRVIYAEGYVPPANRGRRGALPDGNAVTPEQSAHLVTEAVATAKAADTVIFVGGLNRKAGFDTEGSDRRNIILPAGQDDLIRKIVEANPKTVVVLIGGGAVEMDESWLSRVPALLYAWYPGLEGGNALAHVLFGDVNPSGKLPCTFPKRLADTPATALDAYPGTNGVVTYKEGLLVGYRWYDTKNIEPLFPFGYGLSYTHFAYSNLNLAQNNGSPELPLTVEFELANTGGREGAEVAEIYVQPVHPGVFRPVKELKGFAKVFLQAGEKQKVSVTLDQNAFAYYDVARKNWVAEKGEYKILVGSSSRDIHLTGEFHLTETVPQPDRAPQVAQGPLPVPAVTSLSLR